MKKRKFVTFDCTDCGKSCKRRADSNKSGGKCRSCVHRKRPYESIYMGLFHDHRNTEVTLSYEEYLTFVGNPCCYCGSELPWKPYGFVEGKYISRAYFLDRKDHDKGYSYDNCVACCFCCNRMRSNKFTFSEFKKIGKTLQTIYKERGE